MKPASELPWQRVPLSSTQDQLVGHGLGAVILSTDESPEGEQNRAYVIHCCNLYPELVEALAVLTDHASERYPHFESERGQREITAARALLAKCEGGAQ